MQPFSCLFVMGEWREDRTAYSVGLYNVFEDLGNEMIRYHMKFAFRSPADRVT